MLTEKDLDEIEKIIDQKFDEKLKILPTKDEFFSKMDEAMGELKTTRDEQVILGDQVSKHEDCLFALEKIHPQGQHPS